MPMHHPHIDELLTSLQNVSLPKGHPAIDTCMSWAVEPVHDAIMYGWSAMWSAGLGCASLC
jgi:hypothetical protein